MKKIAFVIIMLCSTGAIAETTYFGTINGAVKDYYPNVHIKNVRLYNNTATSGVNGDMNERSSRNEKILVNQFVEEGRKLCKDDQGYFIDNMTLKHSPFGELNNVFTEISANIVCIDKG